MDKCFRLKDPIIRYFSITKTVIIELQDIPVTSISFQHIFHRVGLKKERNKNHKRLKGKKFITKTIFRTYLFVNLIFWSCWYFRESKISTWLMTLLKPKKKLTHTGSIEFRIHSPRSLQYYNKLACSTRKAMIIKIRGLARTSTSRNRLELYTAWKCLLREQSLWTRRNKYCFWKDSIIRDSLITKNVII